MFGIYSFIYSFFLVSCAESNKQAALKNVCIKRLRQIHASLQTHETEAPLEQAHLHIEVQPEIQLRMEPHMSSNPVMWSQHQLEDCALILLTHLLELQEVQASALLPELVDMVSEDNQRFTAFLEKAGLLETLYLCVSVRVCSISTFCKPSMILNFKHGATPTCSSS